MMMSTNDVSSENSIEIRENFPNVIVKLGKPSDLLSILNKTILFQPGKQVAEILSERQRRNILCHFNTHKQ